MPVPTPPKRRYATGAFLDFTTLTLMVDVELVRAAIAFSPALGRDLGLVPIPNVPSGKHPILIDLSRVRDGRPEPGGVDQHTWSEAMGTALGASMGGLSGAMFGPLGAAFGAAMGASLGKQRGREASERAAHVVGTYNEAMAFVPHVSFRGQGEHLLSLGMLTDSQLSKRLSEIFRSGFGKRMAVIDCRGFSSYDVSSWDGKSLLRARFSPASFSSPAEAEGLHEVMAWLSEPVLGHLGNGMFAVAHVDRFYDDAAVRVAPVTGHVVIEPGFVEGVPAGAWEIGKDEGVSAFQATYVPVRLDFPVPVT